MDKSLQKAIQNRLEDGRLPCNHAFAIAKTQNTDPLTVGLAANDADIRVSRCQLGLFGYGPKSEGKHKIVQAMDDVPERLAVRLRDKAIDGGITCAAIWEVADALGYKRIEASGAVEAIGLHISLCQLGCFPRPWTPPANTE